MDATVVCIDQTKKSVQVEPRAAWFPHGTRPSVELSGQRDWTCLLGAITEDGDRFFSRFTEYVTADHAKHFILALCNEFEDAVHDSPEEVGIDAPAWTPALAQEFLADAFDVDYSIPSCRRLLKEAGLSYQKPRRTAAESDENEQEEFHDEFKKSGGRWTPP